MASQHAAKQAETLAAYHAGADHMAAQQAAAADDSSDDEAFLAGAEAALGDFDAARRAAARIGRADWPQEVVEASKDRWVRARPPVYFRVRNPAARARRSSCTCTTRRTRSARRR